MSGESSQSPSFPDSHPWESRLWTAEDVDVSLPPPLRVPIDIQPLDFLMHSECSNAVRRTPNYSTGGRLDLRRLPSACVAEKNAATSTTLPADVASPNVGQSRLSFLTTARGNVSASVPPQDIPTHLRSTTASSAS